MKLLKSGCLLILVLLANPAQAALFTPNNVFNFTRISKVMPSPNGQEVAN